MSLGKEFSKGLWRENPVLVLALGLCPALATTTSLENAIGMGLATTFVLVCSNVIISLFSGFFPKSIRIPCFIVVIASFVTIVDLILKGYIPALSASLGLFIPLIVVNCIILGRAEAFASKNGVIPSIFDGIGMGLGFTIALSLMGGIREVLGTGKILNIPLTNMVGEGKTFSTPAVMIMAPGAFMVLGLLLGFFTWRKIKKLENAKRLAYQTQVPFEVGAPQPAAKPNTEQEGNQ